MNGRSAQAQLFPANKRVCVNVLTPEHRDLANLFAGGSADMGARYAAASWITMAGGTEALADAIVSFDCTLEDVQRVGTHHVFIGRWRACAPAPTATPSPISTETMCRYRAISPAERNASRSDE